jgi:hypothetical protein
VKYKPVVDKIIQNYSNLKVNELYIALEKLSTKNVDFTTKYGQEKG